MTYQKITPLDEEISKERNRISKQIYRGDFWKNCPGTGNGYLCCGYQIITPALGCGMYCSYCVLQEYFQQQNQTVFSNFHDLEREVHKKANSSNKVVRIGSGEFADSLFLEHRYGFAKKIVTLFQPYRNILVELKTKSNQVTHLSGIKNPEKVVIGFSLNTQYNITTHELGTASLEERLTAARLCEKMGFWLAFHFDPIIWYQHWKSGYQEVVDRVFQKIHNPSRIAWWSLGGFRTIPSLKARLRKYGRHLPLFSGEMIVGDDNKLRYFRPLRVAFYTVMKELIERYYPQITLYLCMENPEIWRETGLIKRIPLGLVNYLDYRAKEILGL